MDELLINKYNMRFKYWLEGITAFDNIQMKPSDLNADYKRNDVRSKYVTTSGSYDDDQILSKKPDEQFGFNKKDKKNLSISINTNKRIVPMRTTKTYI